jgi:hypothetical protein
LATGAKNFFSGGPLVVGRLFPPPVGPPPPPPPGSGRRGRGTLAGERGTGRVPIPTRGHTLWYSLYVLCGHDIRKFRRDASI